MPCFSATNVRFVSAADQLRDQQKKCKSSYELSKISMRERQPERSKTGYNRNYRKCEEYANLTSDTGGSARLQRSLMRRQIEKPKDTIIPPKEVQRLKKAAQVYTLADRMEALKRKEEISRQLSEEAERQRKLFKEMDDERLAKEAMKTPEDEFDLTNAGENRMTLQRAFLAKQEQEEEVKVVNRIIMDAKCNAVRDAQIYEKVILKEELKRNDDQIARAVIERAKKSLNEDDEREDKLKQIRVKYAQEIRKQLTERENLRFLEAERIEKEAIVTRKANEVLKREEEDRLRKIKERKQKFRAELARITEMSNIFKKMLCEQEQEADMRIAAYQREKQKREAALLAEKKLAKEEFERNQQRLYVLAQKLLESKSQTEEMTYLRERERVEKEFRRKELEAAKRKREIEKQLMEARAIQLEDTKKRHALQVAQEVTDFNVLVKRLQDEEEKQKHLDEERNRRGKCYRHAIIKQMNDKELERRRKLDQAKASTIEQQNNERQRENNIKTVINNKLKAMREACLPEKYIKDVEQQLKKIDLKRRLAK